MVRRASVRRAVLTVAVLASAGVAGAQGLGATAQQAEEARKAGQGKAIVIKELPAASPDAGPVRLNEQVLLRYAEARVALAALRQADGAINRRLDGAMRTVQNYEDLVPRYAREQPVVDLLAGYGLTPQSYIAIEIAVRRGRTHGLTLDRYVGRDRDNIVFVRENREFVDGLWNRCMRAEGGLRLWVGLIPNYYSHQNLGAAAKKAEEERRTSAGTAIRIELAEMPGAPLTVIRLDKPTIEHYAKARIAMANIWNRDEALFLRLRGATAGATTYREFAAALAGEPQMAEVLKLYGYTPESFVSTELSIKQAEQRMDGGYDPSSLTHVERANCDFMARHMIWVRYRRGSIHKAEAGYTIWR